MFSKQDNIEIFKQTRALSKDAFILKETEKMINNTKVYKEPNKCQVIGQNRSGNINVIASDSVSMIWRLQKKYDGCMAVLNFADALTPGGLVLNGEYTQEESLCRCSNLYESLIKQECVREYYGFNRQNAQGGLLYSDRMIYSPNVIFFRDSNNYEITKNYVKCSVITSPAPDGTFAFIQPDKYFQTVLNRIKGILKVASSNENKAIILGAWGCGAFGGNPTLISKAFKEALKEINTFDMVIFAIYCKDAYDRNFIEFTKII